jgi:hypothetical protein
MATGRFGGPHHMWAFFSRLPWVRIGAGRIAIQPHRSAFATDIRKSFQRNRGLGAKSAFAKRGRMAGGYPDRCSHRGAPRVQPIGARHAQSARVRRSTAALAKMQAKALVSIQLFVRCQIMSASVARLTL